MEKFDFGGWATRANLKCSDGRTIMKDAFKHQDGKTCPLVWNHQHDGPENILGQALLEHRDEGVYVHCKFNDSENGRMAKLLVDHGDITNLSIHAGQLKEQGGYVSHGVIREVSLVLAGANPGAFIDAVLKHGEESEGEGIIYTDEEIDLCHADDEESEETEQTDESNGEEAEQTDESASEEAEQTAESNGEENDLAHADEGDETKKSDDKTVGEVLASLNDEQKATVFYLIAKAKEAKNNKDEESEDKTEKTEGGNNTMKHNVFDNKDAQTEKTLSHSDMEAIIATAKRSGSLRDAFANHGVSEETLAHAVKDAAGNTVEYGMANVDYLFPDARTVGNTPDFIQRDTSWVTKVMQGAKHLPFSRVKSVHANITMEEARARGYVKGKRKVEEVFALLKRITTPTTIYKKQKMDRDDVIDIVDFDVIAWLKGEMRMMLDEEIARAALIGDGRLPGTDDKISEEHIRPIWKDDETYTVRKSITLAAGATADDKAKAFIRTAVKSRKDYKGSGNPTLFTTEDVVTDCLLLEDKNGRVIYDTLEKLKTALRVKDIVTVPVMENQVREGAGDEAGSNFELLGIIVNMADYGFGADKGGAVNMFDDFDIDFNQQKYLIETRCSGALMKPYSAVVLELKSEAAAG